MVQKDLEVQIEYDHESIMEMFLTMMSGLECKSEKCIFAVNRIKEFSTTKGRCKCLDFIKDKRIKNDIIKFWTDRKISESGELPCKMCGGKCCRRRPGTDSYVTLYDDEVENYDSKYITKDLYGEYHVKTKDNGVGCIFFDEKTKMCSIYDNRPKRCREFDCRIMPERCFFFDDFPSVLAMLKSLGIYKGGKNE